MPSNPIQKKIDRLYKTIKDNYSTTDLDLVILGLEYAEQAHQGQKRISGEPYIIHPIAIAQKLANMNLDMPTIIAGLLHDVVEDTNISIKDVEKDFGKEVAMLVDGVTQLKIIKYRGIERYAENLRKMFMAMSQDIRIILIRFADRIHNLETLDALRPDKRLRIAQESLEIYAPIADRLGMGAIKGELEDLAFKHVYPEEYKWITEIRPKQYKDRGHILEAAKKQIIVQLKKENIPFNQALVHGRTKHVYSLYKKLLRQDIDKDINKVYDLIALRIIVPSVPDCYLTLGVIHKLYKPLPKRIKDYIAQPKPNGYQSLHTSVVVDHKYVIEVQIRTLKMHQEAEFGIAAHWRYKESDGKNLRNMAWLEDLVKWQRKNTSNEEFLKKVKLDVFRDRIFVFSPKGDVFDLPEGSTPVDYAYHVHTKLGNQCVGAKINNQIVNLNHKLKSGDLVEIITDKNRAGPSIDWLNFVKTQTAKSKIKSTINQLKKIMIKK